MLSVGLIEAVAKLLFYYLHKRGWNAVNWRKVKAYMMQTIKNSDSVA